MKTIVKTEVIPATEAEKVQHTVFGCDHCDFESDEEDKVAEHQGKTHACKRRLTVGGLKGHEEETGRHLYWFDTEEDALSWLKAAYEGWGNDYHIDGVSWSDSGWYVAETGTRPCRRGCCRDEFARLVTIESVLWELKDDAKRTMKTYASIRKAIKEAEPCPTS